MKIYDGYDRIDLTVGMKNKDKPDGPERGWCAGQQVEALKYYAPEDFEVLADFTTGGYQGDIYVIARWNGKEKRYVLLKDSYGSCSGCDGLEDEDGYRYIRDVLRNNTWQFLSLADMLKYIDEKDFRGESWYGFDDVADDVTEWLRKEIDNIVVPQHQRDDVVINVMGHRRQR